MPPQIIVCISVDGLRASALGAYGNAWHPTPALDALASRSTVFDWMFCERPTLAGFFDAVWRTGDEALPRLFAAANVQTALTTDDPAAAERGEAAGFAEIRRIDFTANQTAEAVADTELAQLFAIAIDQLSAWAATHDAPPSEPRAEDSPARLLWLHVRGYHGAWDAPQELRESLLEEGDPPAPTFTSPPDAVATADADELLLHRVAYAAQTMVLDECIDALAAALAEFGLSDTTAIVLVGARGFALGEHGVVGREATSLYGELLQVPCLIHLPGSAEPPPRVASLAQPADLYSVLTDLIRRDAGSGEAGVIAQFFNSDRQAVISLGDDGERTIRTSAWFLRRRPASEPLASADVAQLYRKPDDRWEANEIADRMPEVAARLLARLDDSAASTPLDDDLVAHAS